jgi:hypothetical protein
MKEARFRWMEHESRVSASLFTYRTAWPDAVADSLSMTTGLLLATGVRG